MSELVSDRNSNAVICHEYPMLILNINRTKREAEKQYCVALLKILTGYFETYTAHRLPGYVVCKRVARGGIEKINRVRKTNRFFVIDRVKSGKSLEMGGTFLWAIEFRVRI
jgi:hypothetical protein